MKTKIFAVKSESEENAKTIFNIYFDYFFSNNKKPDTEGDCVIFVVEKSEEGNISIKYDIAWEKDLKKKKNVIWTDVVRILSIQRLFLPSLKGKPESTSIFVCRNQSEKKRIIKSYTEEYFEFKTLNNFYKRDHEFVEVDFFEGTLNSFTKAQILEKYPQYSKTFTLPAGSYYIGDPCYVYNNDHPKERELWREVCDAIDHDNTFSVADVMVDGIRMIYASTAHGDGVYKDNKGNRYCVDAGIIGIVSANICDKDYYNPPIANWGNLGHFHEFKNNFKVTIEMSTFRFGDVYIDTN